MSLLGRNRTRRARQAAGDLHPAARLFLLEGRIPEEGDIPAGVRDLPFQRDAAAALWAAHRSALIAEATGAGFSPYGLFLFEGRELDGVANAWRPHRPEYRALLRGEAGPTPCPNCGGVGSEWSCLAPARAS